MIEAARRLLESNPTLRFQVAAASEQLADEMRKMVTPHLDPLPSGRGEVKVEAEPNESSYQTSASPTGKTKMEIEPNESSHQTPLPLSRVRSAKGPLLDAIEIAVGQTAAIMQHAFVGIVASGSATLEAAYFGMPFVLIYKVAWPTYVAARLVVNVDFLGMPNLLAGKEVVPEFIQHEAKPDAIVKAVRLLMEDSPARDRMISDFVATTSKLGGTGASERAAQAILEELQTGAPFTTR